MRTIASRRPLAAACLAAAVLVLTAAPATHAAGPCGTHPWCDEALAPAARAALVLEAMTPAEKLELVASGASGDPRLGIPPIRFIDGPNGIGEGSTGVTAFPDAET